MLDPKGTELMMEMVAEIGSVEDAVVETAKQSLVGILSLVAQGNALAEALGGDSNMVAQMLEDQMLAQGMALILAGAFLMESYPAEMEAFVQATVQARDEYEADLAAQDYDEGFEAL